MEKEQTYPVEFLLRMELLLGDEYPEFLKALDQPAPVSVRVNPYKNNELFVNSERIPWCKDGYYLATRPVFTIDPVFQAGGYYVQEASSMFLEQVITHLELKQRNITVLDLSAAPGGKSTHLLSLLSKESLLVANEVIKSRVSVLEENIVKWGCSNFVITNNDPSDFTELTGFFDVILVDAPCSGEGMFRKDKQASKHWNPSNVDLCVSRQNRIINDILPALKPDGYLIYSTCTWNEQENENNIKNIVGSNDLSSVRIPLQKQWGVVETKTDVDNELIYSYRFYPHKLNGEGFFISCLKKAGINDEVYGKKIKKSQIPFASVKDKNVIAKWLTYPDNFEFLIINEQLFAIKKTYFENFLQLKGSLYLKSAGLNMGKVIRDELIPSHDLALSVEIASDVPFIELDLKQAIDYLRKVDIVLETSTMQGWVIVKYKGLSLGWVKVLKNRINNYFPKELRIRMQV
ncbi:MAG: rRNA methyltransferase [Bacteroidetes bacterium]|nr:rRNA methyltransferase [Bacteroidota bacterium]HET6244746.1 rRNA methyltransferase [Bacteroidia bacterium]